VSTASLSEDGINPVSVTGSTCAPLLSDNYISPFGKVVDFSHAAIRNPVEPSTSASMIDPNSLQSRLPEPTRLTDQLVGAAKRAMG
jgi:hypothetical protein